MIEFFKNLFSQEFMPHGHCLFWKTELLRLYIIGDGLTAIAYYSIPIAIAYFVCKRKDIAYKSIFILFGVFILLCGTTHLMFIWTLWNPMYRLEIVIKLITGVVSIATAIIVWPIISKALTLPSPAQLRKVNDELTQEINNHKRTETQLKELSSQLESKVEERTKDLVNVNRTLKEEIIERKQSGKLLQESEERFRVIFEQAAVGVAQIETKTGQFIRINKRYCDIVGYTQDEMNKTTFMEITHPDDLQTDLDYMQKLTEGKIREFTLEKRYNHKDGSIVWVSLTVSPMWNVGGKPDYHIAVVEDITERKKIEEALQYEREYTEHIVSTAPNLIRVITPDGTTVFVNDATVKIMGYTREEILGKNWWKVFYPGEEYKQVEPLLRDLLNKEALNYEMILTTKNKEKRLISWNSVNRYDKHRKLIDIIGIGTDITERKVVEQALKESEEKFRTISAVASDAIIMSDNNSAISYWNKAAERIFGYSAEEAIGKKLQKTIIPEEYREAHLKGFDKFKDSGKGAIIGTTFEITAQRKDGAVFPIEISITAVKLKGNWCAIGIIRDITERKKAEDELQKAHQDLEKKVVERTKEVEEKADRLEKSERALLYLLEDVNEIRDNLEKANIKLKDLDQLKSMFIASMSHELRTPLNSIIGFTGIILQGIDGEINPQQNDHLGRVNRSAKHLLALINDIIDLSKVEAGKVDVFVEDVVLDEVINEVVDSVRLQANEKGLALDVSVPQGVRMNTDRKRLYQCILNCLSNAVKFTESGTVSITAHDTNGEVEIIVSDTGIGISTEDQQRLFQPFVRIDSPLRAKVLGTGLGLYLTRKLTTELLEGTVDVQSQPGKGSTFTLKLPKEIKKDC